MISPERSHELLRAYAATRCGTAFRELVTGWSGMVYATALRVARGQEALAEDITQTVFSQLAAAPEKIKDPRALGAWLHAAATGSTLAALRIEARRRRREQTSQQHLPMSTPPLPGPGAGDDPHALTPEIDCALSQLPPHDSQLLLMRFWQQQDWRSIAHTFGLSDDAAQKRMTRALQRLRRILARRGITSTAGALTAVLVATVPPDLPAVTLLKIISATHIPASSALTATTTVVMTTKTKVALAAAALVIAATVPMVYQHQRIATLREEIQSLRQSPAVSALPKPSAAALAQGKKSSPPIPAKLPDAPPSPQRPAPTDPLTDKGTADFEALTRGKIKEKLAVLRTRLSLTPGQETKIASALEYGKSKINITPPNVIVQKPTPGDIEKMDRAISDTLTPGQQKEYASFRAEENANAVEAVANRELSRLQSLTTLSPEQKDQAFAALSEIAAGESNLPVLDPDKDPAALTEARAARWAARQEALRPILTPEQMSLYQQHGNPFPRGAGG